MPPIVSFLAFFVELNASVPKIPEETNSKRDSAAHFTEKVWIKDDSPSSCILLD